MGNFKIKDLTDEEEARIQKGIAEDPDNPEWTEEDFRNAQPFAEAFPELAESIRRSRGRPAVERPKRQISLRLDPDVIEAFKATGKGWQGHCGRRRSSIQSHGLAFPRERLSFLAMRSLAFLLMFFGWLVYGTVSAWAGCPMCLAGVAPASPQNAVHNQHAMSGMAMTGMSMNEPAKAETGKRPCSATDGAHMSFCAACLALTPDVAFDKGGNPAISRPTPGPVDPLRGMRTAPVPPPPRFS